MGRDRAPRARGEGKWAADKAKRIQRFDDDVEHGRYHNRQRFGEWMCERCGTKNWMQNKQCRTCTRVRTAGQDFYISEQGVRTRLMLDANGDVDERASKMFAWRNTSPCTVRSRSPRGGQQADALPKLPHSRSHSPCSEQSARWPKSVSENIGVKGLAEQLKMAKERGFSSAVIEMMEKELEQERTRKEEEKPAGVKLDQARVRLEKAINRFKKTQEANAELLKAAREKMATATQNAEERLAAVEQEIVDANEVLNELGIADDAEKETERGEIAGVLKGILNIAEKFTSNEVPSALVEALQTAHRTIEKADSRRRSEPSMPAAATRAQVDAAMDAKAFAVPPRPDELTRDEEQLQRERVEADEEKEREKVKKKEAEESERADGREAERPAGEAADVPPAKRSCSGQQAVSGGEAEAERAGSPQSRSIRELRREASRIVGERGAEAEAEAEKARELSRSNSRGGGADALD